MSELAQRIGALSSEKRALLSRRLAEQAAGAPEKPVPGLRPDPCPLSFPQEEIWCLQQLYPASPCYNVPVTVRLDPSLDPRLLRRCLDEIVRRHEAVRTRFAVHRGEPIQIVVPPAPLLVSGFDLRHLEPEEQAAEARRLMMQDARQPFDLGEAPLMRASVIRLSHECLLYVNVHHIAADGWSSGIIISEISTLYEAFAAGRRSPLPALPLQYADYAVWQRQRPERFAAELGYWKAQLGGGLPEPRLPADRPRPLPPTQRGAKEPVSIPNELTDRLAAFSRLRGTTLFVTLLAGLSLLLHRYSGQKELVIGVTHANRDHDEVKPLIGYFVNMLLVRVDLSGDPRFTDLLDRVRVATIGASAHHGIPFNYLLRRLRASGDLPEKPRVPVVLNLQNVPIEVPDVVRGYDVLDNGTCKFDFAVHLALTERGLEGYLEYSTDLFERASISRLLEHYAAVLAQVVADPGRRLLDVPVAGGSAASPSPTRPLAPTPPPEQFNFLPEGRGAVAPDDRGRP